MSDFSFTPAREATIKAIEVLAKQATHIGHAEQSKSYAQAALFLAQTYDIIAPRML